MAERNQAQSDNKGAQRELMERERSLPGVATVMDVYGRLSASTYLMVNVQPSQVRNATGGNVDLSMPTWGELPSNIACNAEVVDPVLCVAYPADTAQVNDFCGRYPDGYDAEGRWWGHDHGPDHEHRSVGSRRSWCLTCHEWCYPHAPCVRCAAATPQARRG